MALFDHMTFPPYEFHEYPKWIYPKDGEPYIVHGPEDDPEKQQEQAPDDPPKRRGRKPKADAE